MVKSMVVGIGMGTTFGIMFCNYALAFYVGTNFVSDGHMSPGTMLSVSKKFTKKIIFLFLQKNFYKKLVFKKTN